METGAGDLPRLAPVPPPPPEVGPSNISSGRRASDEFQASALRARRRTANLACIGCRKKKIRCSGSAPCVRCMADKQECTFIERKAVKLKKEADEMEKALSNLFQRLRDGDQSVLEEVQSMARANNSLHDFIGALSDPNYEGSFTVSKNEDGHFRSQNTPNQHYARGNESSSTGFMASPAADNRQGVPSIFSSSSDYAQLLEGERGRPIRDNLYPEERRKWHPIIEILDLDDNPIIDEEDSEAGRKEGYYFSEGSRNSSASSAMVVASVASFPSTSGHYQGPPWFPTTGYIESFGNLPMSSAIKANGYPQPIQAQQLLQFSVPDYAIQSLHVYENSALSKAYLGYRDAASHQLACGVPIAEVFGPEDYIDVELFFRDRTPSDPYNTCSFACEILKNFEGTDLFTRLVVVKLLTHLMRWMLVPSPENYAKVPPMIRPLPAQRLIPHSPCVDICPHPGFREALMLRYRDFITCGEMDSSNTSIGWPYTLAEAVEIDPITGRRRLTRAFEEHGTNPSNWSWSPSVARTFPEVPALLQTFGGRFRDSQ